MCHKIRAPTLRHDQISPKKYPSQGVYTPATATIQLGNYGRLSGVVIVTRGGNVGRLNAAILQTSINGTDWKDAHTFAGVSQVQRLDLLKDKIDAGYVRVIQPNHPSLHFHKFLVYGKKQN